MAVTDKEAAQFGTLSVMFLPHINELLQAVETIDEDNEFYIAGEIEVRHPDGWRAGYLKFYEDWWIFVPDYKDLT